MPTELHPSERASVISALTRALEETTFSIATLDFPRIDQCASEIQTKLAKKKAELFAEHLGPDGISSLLGQFLAPLLEEMLPEGVEDGKLNALPGWNSAAVSERFVELLTRIPEEYWFTVPLPAILAKAWWRDGTPAMVVEKIAVVGTWHQEFEAFPSGIGDIRKHGRHADFMPNRDVLFVHLKVNGFLYPGVATEAPSFASHALRSFIGLCKALDVFRPSFRMGSFRSHLMSVTRPTELSRVVEQIALDRADAEYIERLWPSTRMNSADTLGEVLSHMAEVHNAPGLTLAAKWFFECEANPDEVMAFMQASIVAEILLNGGKNDDGGLTETLATKCAYSLAATSDERDSIYKSFRDIYRTRSKIVHTGMSRLGPEEKKQFSLLKRLCSRLLANESRMFVRATERREGKSRAVRP